MRWWLKQRQGAPLDHQAGSPWGRRDDGTTFGEGGGGEGWVNGDDGLLLEENHGRCDIF